MAPRSLRQAVALFVFLELATADNSAVSGAAGDDTSDTRPANAYQGALESAHSALDRIQELRHSVQESGQLSLESAEASAEKEVEASLGVSRQHLEETFAQLQKKASAAADRAKQGSTGALVEANEALRGMESANEQLKALDRRVQGVLEDRSRTLEDAARSKARQAEEQADKLARAARKQTDNLDRVARESEMPDLSDGLDREAERVARAVQDEAEKGARKAEDVSRKLPRDFHRRQKEGARERRRALEATRQMIEVASQETSASPVMLASQPTEPAPLLATAAVLAGTAAAGLVAFVRQRCQDEEEMDNKYLLVV
eukprot:TRINITY_DN109902_c0_g1_i1.p1 TRINITY_DN109902_c0_g1~~TRINITY_DN109902_c0_g1_i1.p1  ORF type:complete len:338 (+),score=92.13 TRINITY_DN109902_c0_g1_i1:65-1015(+)